MKNAVVMMVIVSFLMAGCATTGSNGSGLGGTILGQKGTTARKGTLRGGGGGAAAGMLAGQLIGHNTQSTLIGGAAGLVGGALLGRIIGHEKDQTRAIRGTNAAVQNEAAIRSEENYTQGQAILRATLDEGILFDKGSAMLTTDASQRLRILAQALQENPEATLTLTGHASPEGSAEVNAKLAQDRAQAVFNGLTALGVNPVRMSTTSLSASQPVSTSNDALTFSRRVTFTVN